MKRIFTLLSIAALLFSACEPTQETNGPEEYAGDRTKVTMSDTPIPYTGGSLTATVASELPFTVSVPKTASWLTASVSGDQITFTATENPNAVLRYASVAIIDSNDEIVMTRVEVRQDPNPNAEPVEHTLSVAPLSIAVEADATSATFDITSDTEWVVEGTGVTVSPESGNGNATVTVTFPANEKTEEVTYTVSVKTGDPTVKTPEYSVVITQAAFVIPPTHTFEVTPTEISVEADATAAEITVEGDVAWTATGEGVTLEPASGEGNGKIAVSFPANDKAEPVTYTIKVSTTVEGVETPEYTVVITQKGIQTGPTYEMLAQWHFKTEFADILGAHFAEAAKIDGAVNPASNAVGFGEDLYCAANESGNGRMMFYNATDKTDINPKGRCKRGIGNSGEPCWYGAWLGDYIWMEATPSATLPAGTTLNLWICLRPNTQNTLKYWLVEINDGGKWVPVGDVQKATVNGVDVNYNVELKFDPNGEGTIDSPKKYNCEIDRNYTLTKAVDKVEYRIVCQSLMIADGTKVVTYIGETSAKKDENSVVRVCGEDSEGTPTVTHHTWIAIVK